MFLTCTLIGLLQPEPAGRDSPDDVFERPVRPRESEGTTAPKRIDLYKRDGFILEAKQSRLPGRADGSVPQSGGCQPFRTGLLHRLTHWYISGQRPCINPDFCTV